MRTLRAGRSRAVCERGFHDEISGEPTRYPFARRGAMISNRYLFETPLARVCRDAGLVGPDGNPMGTMHRLRHTVGTQLAERGAKLQTVSRCNQKEQTPPQLRRLISRASSATSTPARARATAVARPSLLLAPVTIATCPSNALHPY